jgi:hypothetical protein
MPGAYPAAPTFISRLSFRRRVHLDQLDPVAVRIESDALP